MKYDEAAVERFEKLIRKIAWGYTNDVELHKDLLQEGLIALGGALRTHDPEKSSISNHVYIRVRSAMSNYLNYSVAIVHVPIAQGWKTRTEELVDYDEKASTDAEPVSDLMDYVARILPPAMTTAVYRHYYEDVPIKDLAEEAGVNYKCFHKRIQDALKKLRRVMGDDI